RRLRAGRSAGAALADVAVRTVRACPDARANLLLTDGRNITATRCGDTLWYRAAPGAFLVASEPSDAEPPGGDGWLEVPEHSLLRATAETVEVTPLPAAPAPRPSPPAPERMPSS
ncbi:class II glutamine amidotransferase, partial [Streptomyces sp. CNQ085]|uniref:class II glutamine amidotransferase n=1 Tax=Streptomyces sp. CNQ085 TaxID=2886944 RepID=UPI0035B3257C|nr:class II glutamine amidotransferase [Streptomyces sp. CNQ085]